MSEHDDVATTQAVYDASADRYVAFAGTELSSATEVPFDRSMLETFVQMVASRSDTQVADIGCGPGRVAAFLASRDLDVIGVDVSTEMLGHARRAHPEITFEEGRLDHLPFSDGCLGGAVCWYSIIHAPPARLDGIFAELLRTLRPGGLLLLAFQAGHGQALHQADAHGTGRALTTFRHALGDVTSRLGIAGFSVYATAQRQPELAHESTTQAFVLATVASFRGTVTDPPL
ncbi:MAG: Methyltransferase type 11 [Ilumatobacteraceae bacterium]|nr:Methyltransferase type 11 [Ilumatobacteraceae bacterium]